MATHGINTPPPFLTAPNTPVFDTEFYIDELKIYLTSIGADKFTEARRVAILLNVIGPACRRILVAASKTLTSVEGIYDLLRKLFPSSVSFTVAREKFNLRVQQTFESTIDFFASISSLASKCEYGALCDDLVRDKLILGSKPAIKEKLILEQPKTMQSALETALRIETVQAELGAKTSMDEDGQVNSVQTVKPKSKRKLPFRCYRCNKQGVKANHPNCRAMGQTCNNCGKKNHFASVCFNSSKDVNQVNSFPAEPASSNVLHVFSNFSSHVPMKFVDIACMPTDKSHVSNTFFSKVMIQFGVDTGSSVNLIPVKLCRQLFPSIHLTSSGEIFKDFSGNVIPVHGYFSVCMSFSSYESIERIYVVNNDNPPLVGIQTFETLHLHTLWDNMKVNAIGCARKFAHEIQLKPDAVPSVQKLRRVPISLRAKVSQELQRLVDEDIIEPVDRSEWVSNMVVVQKPNGDIRLCLDLRELNRSIVTDKYPLPHTEEVFLEMQGCQFFSIIDLKQAFLQLPLHASSKQLTAFITHDGLFQFKRTPFGLASAPSAFQKIMTVLLSKIHGVQVYLDDVLIGGKTKEEHDDRVMQVQEILKESGFLTNSNKSLFGQPEIKFMGHLISKDGVKPDPKKVSAIEEAPAPTSPQEVKSFLGMASFYSKFIPNYSTVVEPLLSLTRKNADWDWDEQQKNAFQTIKATIANTTALSIFDNKKDTEIQTDASNTGLGAVLLQKDNDGEMQVIAFASRTLTPAERNYSILEKEALAIVFAVQRWKVFLWGRFFRIITDHRPLTSIFTSRDTLQVNLRVSKYVTQLLPFNYTVHYRKGSENHMADFLSRASCSEQEETHEELRSELTVNSILSDATLSRKDIESNSASDPEIQTIRKWLVGAPDSSTSRATLSNFQSIKHELSVVDGILFRQDRIFLPSSLRSKAIQLAHESHQGTNRTTDQLTLNYYWPNMHAQIKAFVQDCSVCNQSKKTAKFYTSPPCERKAAAKPWHTLGIDIIGPLQNVPADKRYALTVMDYYSRFPYVFFTAEITSARIIQFLRTLFTQEGMPVAIVSDNGPQLTSAEFTEFLHRNDIDHELVPVYWARANGLIERWHRTLKQQLEISVSMGSNCWTYVQNFLAAYRCTPHPETRSTPSFLLHGREMRWSHNPFNGHSGENLTANRGTEAKRAYSHPIYRPKEKVRVKTPGGISLRTVKQRLSENVYLMEDGYKWHVSNMSKLHKLPEGRRQSLTHTDTAMQSRRYPTRDRHPPARLIDS